MVGNYPDPPGYRMAYDRDGTQVFKATSSSFGAIASQLATADLQALNRESSLYNLRNTPIVVIFPELRDLDAIWTWGNDTLVRCETSRDTTNGVDGTWTSYGLQKSTDQSPPSMRKNVYRSTALAIRAVRIAYADDSGSSAGGLHLYGEPSAVPDRLEFWDPAADQKIAVSYFDWGDAARTTTLTKTFRIKNLSSTLTAQQVRIAQEVLTDTTPSIVGQYQISQDGGVTWGPQQTIGDLAPGAISKIIQIRETIDPAATLSLWWFRVFAEALTWAVV